MAAGGLHKENRQRNDPVMAQSPIAASGQRLRAPGGRGRCVGAEIKMYQDVAI